MWSKLSPRLLLPLTFVLAFATALPWDVAAAPAANHCVGFVKPVKSRSEFSSLTPGPCFDNLADAVALATNNKVRLPKSATANEVSKALEAEDAKRTGETKAPGPVQVAQTGGYALGIDWENANKGGSSYVWSDTNPCSSGWIYNFSVMPSGWNDRTSSAQGYSGCNNFLHWENGSFTGAQRNCGTYCSYIGDAMNDKTSSVQMYP